MIVETTAGKIEGVTKDGVTMFRGVPYAAPPVGPLRFRSPEPVEPWSDVRPATSFGAIAPQPPATGMMAIDLGPSDEDCLYLNVWTPSADGERRPVMVWIHGGGFTGGSGSMPMYSGRRLAVRGDVVVVSCNYRVGALGFLAHEALRDPVTGFTGSWGVQDQISALKWVRDNIEAFGGDPANVTVFGESAGAGSIATLLGAPSAAGLFHKAIMQSGGDWARPMAEAEVVAETVAKTAGTTVAGLRDLPAQAVLDAQVEAYGVGVGGDVEGIPFAPTIDGTLIPRPPLAAVAGGLSAGVPLMIGTNLEEIRLWTVADPRLAEPTEANMRKVLGVWIEGDVERERAVEQAMRAFDVYAAARAERGEPTAPLDLLTAIGTDLAFRLPSIRMAEAAAADQPATFMYLFTYRTPAMGGLLGACHVLEVPFVFGTHAQKGMAMFLGEGPHIAALSDQMQDSWLAFARTGAPAGEWPPYDTERRATRVFGPDGGVLEAPMDPERIYWEA